MIVLTIFLALLGIGIYVLIKYLISLVTKKQEAPWVSLVLGILGLITAPLCLVTMGLIGLSMIGGSLGLALGLLGLRKAYDTKKAGFTVPKRYIILNIVVIVISLLNLYFWSPLIPLGQIRMFKA